MRTTGRPVRGTGDQQAQGAGDQQAHLVISSGGTRCLGMVEVLHMCIGRLPPVLANPFVDKRRNGGSDDGRKFQM